MLLQNNDKIAFYLQHIIYLFDNATGVKTIGDFVKRVEEIAASMPFNPEAPTDEETNKINTFKGDMLEVFGEIFFAQFSSDTCVGIREYKPIPITEDYGVDAIGMNVNNDMCAIQYKYRSNPQSEVILADLSKTYMSSRRLNKLNIDGDDTLWLFTTGAGATDPLKHAGGSMLRVINRDVIASYVDNNLTFWEKAEEYIVDTLDWYNTAPEKRIGKERP